MSIFEFKLYVYKNVITIWNKIRLQNTKTISLYFLDLIRITKSSPRKKNDRFNGNKDSGATKSNLGVFGRDPIYEPKSDSSNTEEQELDQDRCIEDYFGFKDNVKVYVEFTSIDDMISHRSLKRENNEFSGLRLSLTKHKSNLKPKHKRLKIEEEK
jgi:hypothetical protein